VSLVLDAGDLVWMNFDPQAAHEQAGRRPALVRSPRIYHDKTALAIVCPITSNTRPYPFKVVLPEGLPISGAVLADQVKSITGERAGWRLRGRRPGRCSSRSKRSSRRSSVSNPSEGRS